MNRYHAIEAPSNGGGLRRQDIRCNVVGPDGRVFLFGVTVAVATATVRALNAEVAKRERLDRPTS
jgi:hypothetical protein